MTEFDTEIDRHRQRIVRLLDQGSVVILTGAGLSTASGIPDYRDRNAQWKGARPIDHTDFLRSESTRRRYWARSFIGWPTVGLASPSRGHHALAQLERRDRIALIITQNVDGLHQKAGSRSVLELHGGLQRVVCLACRHSYPRASVQEWLGAANPGIAIEAARRAPDGDAHVAGEFHRDFSIPACPSCGGVLKPDVVFFGDSVPQDRVRTGLDAIDAARGVLVVGSSLMVYSGFRFVEHAHRHGKPVMAINLGITRADHLLAAKLEQDCDEFLHLVKMRERMAHGN
ncbi:MAG: NAD-dependent protein deacetylase [Rhodocyclales bacterium]|nr:NAD-dependent protein deacetylase [Rhodocyclales bacterium]